MLYRVLNNNKRIQIPFKRKVLQRLKTEYLENIAYTINYPIGSKGYKAILVDYIMRFEHLEKDFKYVCNKLDLPELKLGHYKNSGKYDYKDFYTEKTKKMIEKHCEKDIEYFGWKF